MYYKKYKQKKDYSTDWKSIGLFLAGVALIIALGLITSHEPEFQRECVLFSKGVWSNICIHTP